MNRYLSLFHNKKLITSVIITIVIFLGISFLLGNRIENTYSGYKTWSNTSSTYIAYDKRTFDENCYAYYGKELNFNLEPNKESIVINSRFYQFVADVFYDDKSVLNEKNVINGNYSILENNEIAISKSISKKYTKNIGDFLYLNGEQKFVVKYITKDFYGMEDARPGKDENCVFIGLSDSYIGDIKSYAVFNNVSKEYNKVYLLDSVKKSFISNLIMVLSCLVVLSGSIFIGLSFLFKKEKILYLKNCSKTGNKKRTIFDLFGIELVITFTPVVFLLLVSLLLKYFLFSLVIFVVFLLQFIINFTYSLRRIK